LTNTLDSSPEVELQRQAVIAISRRPKDEAIPILIRTARNHPRVEVRKSQCKCSGKPETSEPSRFLESCLQSNHSRLASAATKLRGEQMSTITWRAEDPLTSNQAANFLRDEAFESRLSSLRDVATELLNAVDSLSTTSPQNGNGNHKLKLSDEVRKFEADLIRAALVRTAGNQTRAARLLGVKHTTLNAKIKRHGISLSDRSGEEIAA